MVQKKKRTGNKSLLWFLIASTILLTLTAFIVTNFTTIKDIIIGMGYRPSGEMEEIREKLNLTGTGARIFNASLPELMEKTEFNHTCREIENESAILGCYSDDKIYIYNIVDNELPGIRELTSAHELLHAVYKRMSSGDKNKWNDILSQVYENNKKVMGEEIEMYPDDQRREEIYVRAGTEVKQLPEELEKHYAEVFKNQDAIVDFYESYIAVFREIEQKMDELLGQINRLGEEVSVKTADYENQVGELNKKVDEFNKCAETLNCFTSVSVFNRERAGLVAEQNSLSSLYDKIEELISKYNNLVTEYNENVLHGQALNMTINSSAKVEEVAD